MAMSRDTGFMLVVSLGFKPKPLPFLSTPNCYISDNADGRMLISNLVCVSCVLDPEFGEILAVAPELRPKVQVKSGALSPRLIKAVLASELRLIHETAVVHPDAQLGEVIPPNHF